MIKLLYSLAKRIVSKRSPQWNYVEKQHLLKEPACQWCGLTDKEFLQVHHITPFHIDRTKELDPNNLITLCMKPDRKCHFMLGHNGTSWLDWNPKVRQECQSNRRFPKL